ncbi:hypothetical protein BE15_00435 [Sorangium cellulosum]|uniref:Uncharacterized protein n=1 Tax=Sorangium cellulosum TaxID=56 RepID=A0A150QJ12_SORCE|nr:hypothetical protein BE15_00435 [Sorangium cellulosum]
MAGGGLARRARRAIKTPRRATPHSLRASRIATALFHRAPSVASASRCADTRKPDPQNLE